MSEHWPTSTSVPDLSGVWPVLACAWLRTGLGAKEWPGH